MVTSSLAVDHSFKALCPLSVAHPAAAHPEGRPEGVGSAIADDDAAVGVARTDDGVAVAEARTDDGAAEEAGAEGTKTLEVWGLEVEGVAEEEETTEDTGFAEDDTELETADDAGV